jgi:transposase
MKPPLFVRPLTDTEVHTLTAGLHAADAFTLRRCQIVLASARGQRPSQIAQAVGCGVQTVRDAIHDFDRVGIAALHRQSSRPHTTHPAFDDVAAERLRELLQRSPRTFGKDTSVWTLGLVAEISFAEGITAQQVSGETVRATLERLGIGWQRAKRWIVSPDPAYGRKKASATA